MSCKLIIDSIIGDVSVEYDRDFFTKKILITILSEIKNSNNNPFDVCKVSSVMNLSERTFYRRLKDIDKTYVEVKDEVKRRYAFYLLNSEHYTIKQISKLLFFKSSSAFIHAFKRWYGCTPKKWKYVIS
ncbi:hypothetical protein AB835_13585 [Candidatus Endobugula sertula]|uniref:HTH araC/xylS-type domain-containing protein n=1 Tax=Candidatus Endobugula sertula TaxID=62101 RepID=A0A1D2QLV1_9GAMM|nr:hypothetical protein AB835_13585 [Candidatus Endobugula sertula]